MLEVSPLNAVENQKTLNIDCAKSALVQQFPSVVSRELSHSHHADILVTAASFLQKLKHGAKCPARGKDIIHTLMLSSRGKSLMLSTT